jgi:hypothetical protein
MELTLQTTQPPQAHCDCFSLVPHHVPAPGLRTWRVSLLPPPGSQTLVVPSLTDLYGLGGVTCAPTTPSPVAQLTSTLSGPLHPASNQPTASNVRCITALALASEEELRCAITNKGLHHKNSMHGRCRWRARSPGSFSPVSQLDLFRLVAHNLHIKGRGAWLHIFPRQGREGESTCLGTQQPSLLKSLTVVGHTADPAGVRVCGRMFLVALAPWICLTWNASHKL